MRRTMLVLALAAMLVAVLGASAVPAVADHLEDLDNGVLDDPEGVLDDDDDEGILDDGDDDDEGLSDGGVICPDEGDEAELILGVGFVCVDDDDELDDGDDDFDDDDDDGFLD